MLILLECRWEGFEQLSRLRVADGCALGELQIAILNIVVTIDGESCLPISVVIFVPTEDMSLVTFGIGCYCVIVIHLRVVYLDANRSEHVSVYNSEAWWDIKLALSDLLSSPGPPFVHGLFGLDPRINKHLEVPTSPMNGLHKTLDLLKGLLQIPKVEVGEKPPRVIQGIHIEQVLLRWILGNFLCLLTRPLLLGARCNLMLCLLL